MLGLIASLQPDAINTIGQALGLYLWTYLASDSETIYMLKVAFS